MEILPRSVIDQSLEARQAPHVITQTITKPYTTLITLVTLGNPPTEAPASDSSSSDSSYGESHGLSNGEIGAIIGSSIGFVFLVLLLWWCCTRRRRGPRISQTRSYTTYDTTYIIEDDEEMEHTSRRKPTIPRPPPVAERIPGGPRYPTYRAIPIPNPRNPRVRHNY